MCVYPPLLLFFIFHGLASDGFASDEAVDVALEYEPHFLYTGSSGFVSGCIWILPSQSAADDFDGSKWAGSDRPLGDCGAHPAPIDEATSEGTIVINDELIGFSQRTPQYEI